MDHEDLRQWMALGSHIFPESYEGEAAYHRAVAGKTSLDDVGGYGFGDPYYNEADDDDESSSSDNDDTDKLVPSWYNSQPFQYNGRMQLISLPGFILIIAITGDLLIGLVTLGSVVIYLLHVAEQRNRAFIAFIIAFFMCHSAVLYSLFPLLWDSFFNFFFLLFVNIFIVLTGAWITLQFEEFYSKEFDVTRKLETFLYCGYPLVNVIILTWVAAALTRVPLAPYFLLLFGFCVLQIFLYPARSSFVKTGIPKETGICEMILDPGFVGLMGLLYAMAPPLLYVMIMVSTNSNAIFTLNTATELTFLGFTSFFLATLLDLRPFFQEADFSVASVNQMRWVCGVVCLLLLSPTLTLHGLQLYLLPYLSIAIIIHASYAYLISHKKTKIYGSLAILSLLGLHIFVFNKLPWQMAYYFLGLVHISVVNGLMFATCVLGMLAVYLSVSGPKELFSGVFVLHTMVLLMCEQILLSKGVYPLILLLISGAAVIYAGFRLQHSSKFCKTANWIMLSIQLTKALALSDHLVAVRVHQSSTISSDWWIYSFSYVSLLIFLLFITKALFFEDNPEISFNKWQVYVLGSGFSVSLQTPMLLPSIYWIVIGSTPSMADVMAIGFGLVSIVCIRLGILYPSAWVGARYVGPTLLAMAVTVAHLQPQLDFQWSEIWKWLIVSSVLSWFSLMPLIATIRNATIIIFLSLPLAAPPSLVLMYMGFGEDYSTVTLVASPILGSALVGLVMIVWRSGPGIFKNAMLLVTTSIAMVFVTATSEGFTDVTVGVMAAICLTTVAICTKALNMSLVNLDMDTQINDNKSVLAWTGNICTCTAFVILFCLSKIQEPIYSEIMTVASSGVLLALQREGLLRRLRKGKIYAPIATVSAWVLWWASWNASLWWTYKNPVHMLTGFIEITLLLLAVPHYFAILPILWVGKHIIPYKPIVFLLPVQFFLLIFADSYWAWLFMLLSVLTTLLTVLSQTPEMAQQQPELAENSMNSH